MPYDLHQRLRGIITVLNTPFGEFDAVDPAALARNIRDALDAGVVGFLVPALASEVYTLSQAERDLLVQTTLETVSGRAVVIGGVYAADDEERLRTAAHLISTGCDGILINIPFTDAETYRRQLHQVAAMDPGFMMIQDWDANGYGLPVRLIAQLFEEIPAFQSLKVEVVPAGVKYSEVLQATNGRLHVAGGWAVTQMIEALDRGVHAFMPTGLHRTYARIYSLYQQGQRDEAMTLFWRLLPVLAFSNQHLDISIYFFKRLLHRQGIYPSARVRSPVLLFDNYHEVMASELIEYALNLEGER